MFIERKKIQITNRQNRDFLILFSLIFLFTQKFGPQGPWWVLSVFFLIAAFLFPKLFTPITTLWFFLGEVLGSIMTKFILFLVFYLFVFPVSLIKRGELREKFGFIFIEDDSKSYFSLKEKRVFGKKDIENPY